MKKFLALILALTMVFSLAGVAFAEDVAGNNVDATGAGSENNPVTVTVAAVSTVYYVEINWDSLSFAYTASATWDPTTHKYYDEGKLKESANITVINHSNAQVWSTASLEEGQGRGFTATLENAAFELERADVCALGNPNDADSAQHVVKVSGQPDVDFLKDLANASPDLSVTVGTVTVTISPTAPATGE